MSDEPTVESLQERIAHLEKERDQAIKKRDVAKMELREREERASLSDQDRAELEELRQAKAAEEEKRQVEAGEFEAAKKKLMDQKAEAEAKAQAAEQRYAQKVVETAFSGASELFGPAGLTTLTPEFAFAGMGRQVEYVPGENGHGGRIVVKALDGEVILGDDGKPAPFGAAMKTLIDQWPGKEQILRAGQRAGSGSTGGTREAAGIVDRDALLARVAGGQADADTLAKLRSSQPRSIVTRGAFFDRELDAKAKG